MASDTLRNVFVDLATRLEEYFGDQSNLLSTFEKDLYDLVTNRGNSVANNVPQVSRIVTNMFTGHSHPVQAPRPEMTFSERENNFFVKHEWFSLSEKVISGRGACTG